MSEGVPGGYAGKILRVNLSANSTSVETKDDRFYRKYLGGDGFIAYFLLKELTPGTDPLGPDNKLVFALGPMTGTSVFANGRNAVGAKSPLSGAIAFSHVGEYWGAELKRAGYDAVIVEGKADKPVYMWIHEGQVSIREAGHLWGRKTKEAQETIRAELGDDKVRVALIGPGGENQVRFACIMNGLYDAAGRGGLGAVMGSKNLKAIAVRGCKAPAVADREALNAVNRRLAAKLYDHWLPKIVREFGTGGPEIEGLEKIGHLPVRNWRDGVFPGIANLHGGAIKNSVLIGLEGCFGCSLRCKKRCKSEEEYVIDPAYGGPEYEAMSALGSNCGVDNLKAMIKCNELCNAYSLDAISTGGTLAFAMECFEKGLLTIDDTNGIELRFGNSDAMIECIELIGRRQDFGNQLAEGTARLAQKIGKGSADFAIQVKGIDPGQHEPRLNPAFALGFMINPHGADHCCNVHDDMFASDEAVNFYGPFGYHEPVPVEGIGPRKVALFKVEHLRQVLLDTLLLCHLAYISFDHAVLVDITSAVTGWHTSVAELMRAAERIMTMARLFNVREGLTAADDRLPKRFFQPKTDGPLAGGGLLTVEGMEAAKKYYYTLMGWDEKGVPLPEKVEELYIEQ